MGPFIWKTARPAPPAVPLREPTYDEIFAQCFRTVYRMLRGRGFDREESKDLAQDVFTIVHQKLPTCQMRETPSGWVYGIASKVASKRYGPRMRENVLFEHGVDLSKLEVPAEPELEHDEDPRYALAVRCLAELPNEDRKQVLLLHYLAEMTTESIAATLDRPLRTVQWQLQRGEDEWKEIVARHMARERREARIARRAVVLPIFGAVDLLRTLANLPEPEGMRAEVWSHLQDRLGGGGQGPIASATPPARPPTSLARAAAHTWGGTAVTILGMVALVEGGVIAGLLLERHHASIDARPDPVTAAITTAARVAPAPSAEPSASAEPSSIPPAAAPRSLSPADINAERVVLHDAEAAIDAHRFKDALDAIERHARRWQGRGALTERREELRADIERYVATHPNDPQVNELRKHQKGTP